MAQIVGSQLGIDELISDEIRENEDRIVRLLVFRVRNVCADLIPVSEMGGSSLMRCFMNSLSSMSSISPLASPSCLTPMVQHRPGRLDAMFTQTRISLDLMALTSFPLAGVLLPH